MIFLFDGHANLRPQNSGVSDLCLFTTGLWIFFLSGPRNRLFTTCQIVVDNSETAWAALAARPPRPLGLFRLCSLAFSVSPVMTKKKLLWQIPHCCWMLIGVVEYLELQTLPIVHSGVTPHSWMLKFALAGMKMKLIQFRWIQSMTGWALKNTLIVFFSSKENLDHYFVWVKDH